VSWIQGKAGFTVTIMCVQSSSGSDLWMERLAIHLPLGAQGQATRGDMYQVELVRGRGMYFPSCLFTT
jgi:hypothetical protein